MANDPQGQASWRSAGLFPRGECGIPRRAEALHDGVGVHEDCVEAKRFQLRGRRLAGHRVGKSAAQRLQAVGRHILGRQPNALGGRDNIDATFARGRRVGEGGDPLLIGVAADQRLVALGAAAHLRATKVEIAASCDAYRHEVDREADVDRKRHRCRVFFGVGNHFLKC
ncbi:MAG: hypothetical protein AAF318_13285 [Pseudomonadota bacterium]